MKKKMCIAAMAVVMMCSMAGCGKNSDKTTETMSVQEDVVEFVNEELPAIRTYRDSAIATYNSYFSSENTDLDTFVNDLETKAIPDMETFISSLEAVDIDTEEVNSLRNLYVSAAEKQCEAMEMVVSAIKEENPDYLTQADLLIKEAESYIAQYESELKLLCIDYDVEINGSF